MSATLPFRLARATAFAVVCLGLSVMGHVLVGSPVPVPAAAGGLVLAFLAALAVSGRERTLAVILPVLAGLQVMLHLLFSLAHAALPAEVSGHAHSRLLSGLSMLVVHGWAAGLTSLWLARGEAALWAMLRRLGVRLRLLLTVHADPAHTSLLTPGTAEPNIRLSSGLRHAVNRRGPPRSAIALSG
ncbi:MFS transporter [Streptosporangium canum]|uniref:MFS transporter n=1 Tax=Streptosporangium canum TaxID=324952 RepID=UPI003430C3E0